MVPILRKLFAVLVSALLLMLYVPNAYAGGVTINVVQNPTLGTILTDSEGNTLYRFTKDTTNLSSACYGGCAKAWPPLLIEDGSNPVAGEGVNGSMLGVLTRTDGTRQVMYNGMPLYYYDKDLEAGDIVGQRVGNVWFIVHPNSGTVGNQGVVVRVREHPSLGNFLTDDAGRTLYLFTKDTADKSVCYGRCADAWPPLLVGSNTPELAPGIGGKLGTTMRDDGNRQVTYESKPLYYFTPDTTIGDTKGQGVGEVWWVLAPVASTAPAAPAAAPVPAALPKTAGETLPLQWLLGLAALLIITGATLQWRRKV